MESRLTYYGVRNTPLAVGERLSLVLKDFARRDDDISLNGRNRAVRGPVGRGRFGSNNGRFRRGRTPGLRRRGSRGIRTRRRNDTFRGDSLNRGRRRRTVWRRGSNPVALNSGAHGSGFRWIGWRCERTVWRGSGRTHHRALHGSGFRRIGRRCKRAVWRGSGGTCHRARQLAGRRSLARWNLTSRLHPCIMSCEKAGSRIRAALACRICLPTPASFDTRSSPHAPPESSKVSAATLELFVPIIATTGADQRSESRVPAGWCDPVALERQPVDLRIDPRQRHLFDPLHRHSLPPA